ncbi:carbohydrate sulfotransferase 4-like isoform X1 [Palaemon carinicauda]|uniref:carbohydrate sulfotransferase 4-like isoform X1 n=1 Tax=Palaemon carinicauda TaxID=392227 RepID=UPI0035B64311
MIIKMRFKHKRPLALALVVTIVNLLIFFYDDYRTTTSADILRTPAVFEALGPGLPPDDVDQPLTLPHTDPEPIPTNATVIIRNTSNILAGELKSKVGADKFLIHSYLKSGASKVAEVLNLHYKELFYFHHPLKALDSNSPFSGFGAVNNKLGTHGMNWVKEIYNCSFQNNKQLISEPEIWKSHSIRNTFKNDCKNIQVPECLEVACKKRPLRAVYTLRLGMDFIFQMMKFYGNKFKVIVVLRDPRSILSNRRHHNMVRLKSTEDFKQHASKLCKTMGGDILYAEQIKKLMPRSILILRYEHFILHPMKMLSYLYKFLGLEVPRERVQEVLNVLGLQVPEEQRLQMTKDWQLELTLQESRAIDYGCKFYYQKLGYFPVPSKVAAYDKYFITLDQMDNIDRDEYISLLEDYNP